MSEPIYDPTIDGQEVQLTDYDLIGAVSGLMDDRVIAEILRMAPFDGSNVFKTILPYDSGSLPGGTATAATVAPSGLADGSVVVSPFRAIVGTRNTAAAAPSPNPAGSYQSSALANWRDVRSGIFIGSATTLTQSVGFAANGSGQPRWDLVYATVAVDANGPSVTRRVKSPSTGVVTPTSVPSYLNSPVSVSVVTGTPGATPALPSLPADAAGNYNIGLYFVRIVNGYSSGSTLLAKDLRAFGQTSNPQRFNRLHGAVFGAASGNNDNAGNSALAAGPANWSPTAHTRPGAFLPTDWGGSRTFVVEVDLSNASSANWSHANAGIVDNSIDWRNRIVRATMMCSLSLTFWNDDTAVVGARIPVANNVLAATPTSVYTQFGNTRGQDNSLVGSSSTVVSATGSGSGVSNPEAGTVPTTLLTNGTTIGLYVLASDGVLRLFVNGAPLAKAVFWIDVSGAFPNP